MQVDELNIQHGPKKNINPIVICSTFLSSVIEINLEPTNVLRLTNAICFTVHCSNEGDTIFSSHWILSHK